MFYLSVTLLVQAEKELEKEMGDAGDDAEVLDEKLWFGEDEGGEGEENESRKDAGASDSKINSKSDDDNRKMVAGGEDEQEDEKGDGDKADDAQVLNLQIPWCSVLSLDRALIPRA